MTNHLLLASVCAATCLAVGEATVAQARTWREGERVSALRLPTIDGQGTFDLRELTGKRTLLIEFASW